MPGSGRANRMLGAAGGTMRYGRPIRQTYETPREKRARLLRATSYARRAKAKERWAKIRRRHVSQQMVNRARTPAMKRLIRRITRRLDMYVKPKHKRLGNRRSVRKRGALRDKPNYKGYMFNL